MRREARGCRVPIPVFVGVAGLLLASFTIAGCFGNKPAERPGSVDGYVFKPVGRDATTAGLGLKVLSRGPAAAPPPGYEPCPGAVVTVTGSSGVTETDRKGYFRTDGVSPGTQTVSIVYGSYHLSVKVAVYSGKVTTVNATTGNLLGKWTVMVYMCADNNLEAAGIADINEMELVGSTEDVSILVQVDRRGKPDGSDDDWEGARRYYIRHDEDSSGIGSDVAYWFGAPGTDNEIDMGDPAELRDFVTWCVANYPAQHYVLVLWNHGDGWTIWRSPTVVVPRAICFDDQSGHALDVDRIRTALEGLPRLDIIGFDACLMQMAEVAYEVRGIADIAVGSQENEPEDGWDYEKALTGLCASPNTTAPWDLARAIVDSYTWYYSVDWVTQSAFRLEQSDDVAMAAKNLKDELIYRIEQDAYGTDADRIRKAVKSARGSSREYYVDYYDLEDFAANLVVVAGASASGISGDAKAAICARAQAVVDRLSDSWVYARGNGNGLSIYLPDKITPVYGYDYLQFEQDTHWSELFKHVIP